MCGISGVLNYTEQPVDQAILDRMGAILAHRGPDDSGTYLSRDRRVGFSFRRLAIVDLSPAGHQPMSNEDGTVWLIFNGEVYNHADHRADLQARGHEYRGRSDSETIIHLYEEYGEDCVHYLRGMFSFAIWDERRQRLFIARDRIGIKPLYYTRQNGAFVFASEIKAILGHPGIRREADDQAMYHYFSFMVPPAPLTMFKDIHKLPAGCRMTVDARGEVRIERYWDAIVERQPPRSDEDHAEAILSLLRESIRLRMMSDVPIGVFLSGGVDSSTNVALLSELTGGGINTLSVGFREYEQYNELHYARHVASRFGTTHHEIIIDHHDALEYIPQMIESQDEPIADWVCIPLYFVSRLARENGIIVVHVGEGADELFCGYPAYQTHLRRRRLWPVARRVPRRLWKAIAATAGKLGGGSPSAVRAQRLFQRMTDEDGLFWGGAVVFRHAEKDAVLDVPYWKDAESRLTDSASVIAEIEARIGSMQPLSDELERMVYVELKHRLPELLLMRVDKVTMSTSIEARVPFLDHKLVEYAMQIPQHVKLRGGVLKALLKKAVRNVIPDEIIARPKQGFGAPVAEWLRKDFGDEVRRSLMSGELARREIVNLARVEELFLQHRKRVLDRSVQLWNLYNLEMWYQRYLS